MSVLQLLILSSSIANHLEFMELQCIKSLRATGQGEWYGKHSTRSDLII